MSLCSKLSTYGCACVLFPAAGHNADYSIVVEHEGSTEEIRVHRLVLEARSPFFRGMLESNMAESQQGRFVIRDMAPVVVKVLLHFVYTGAWRRSAAAGAVE